MNAAVLLAISKSTEMNGNPGYTIVAILALLIMLYLLYALINPEKL